MKSSHFNSFISDFFLSVLFVRFIHVVCNFVHSLCYMIIPLYEHTSVYPVYCRGSCGLFPVFCFGYYKSVTKNIFPHIFYWTCVSISDGSIGFERRSPNMCIYLPLCLLPNSFAKWMFRDNTLQHIKEGTESHWVHQNILHCVSWWVWTKSD